MENSITDRSSQDEGTKQNYTNEIRKEHEVKSEVWRVKYEA